MMAVLRSAPPSLRPSPAPPTRTTYAALAALFALFVVYGSWVPFTIEPLTAERFAAGVDGFLAERIGDTSIPDFVSNVALLVPFGFLLAGALCLDAGRLAVLFAAPLVLAAGLALSLTAELGQIAVADRVASVADVCWQTCGDLVGLLIWAVAGRRLTAVARGVLSRRRPTRVVTRLLVVYAVGLVIAELQPLDLTIHPWELLRKYDEGRILFTPDAARLLTPGSLLDVLRFIPLGALCAVIWNRPDRRRSAPRAVVLGTLVVAALEATQVLLYSRVADVLDLLTGSTGIAAGVALTRLLARSGAGDRDRSPAVPAALAVAWVAVLAIVSWSPFDFTWRPDIVHDRLMLFVAVPFGAYQSAPIATALPEILKKILLALPLGALLAWTRPGRAGRVAWSAASLALALGVLFFLESGQVLLPARYPDLTDVILGGLGAAAGVLVAEATRR